MNLTIGQFVKCLPDAGDRINLFAAALNDAMAEFFIETMQQQACFLAQVAHESGNLRYTKELWGPTPAQLGYEGRADLGNTQPGDGKLFMGRGLIQVTGRTNTMRALFALSRPGTDLDYLETPVGASRSAAWFWKDRGLNDLAARGLFWSISKKINGGTNGLDERIIHYVRIRRVLGI